MLRILKSLKEPTTLGTMTKREEKLPMAFSSGQIIPNMKVNGSTTKQMAKVNSGVQTETLMKVIGRMIKLMASERSSRTTGRRDT